MSRLSKILKNTEHLKAYTFAKIGFILGLFGIFFPISFGIHFQGLDLLTILFLLGLFIIFSVIPAFVLGLAGYFIGYLLDK